MDEEKTKYVIQQTQYKSKREQLKIKIRKFVGRQQNFSGASSCTNIMSKNKSASILRSVSENIKFIWKLTGEVRYFKK